MNQAARVLGLSKAGSRAAESGDPDPRHSLVTSDGKKDTMMKFAGLALLLVAVGLLVWGLEASGTIQSDFSRFFRGGPSDRTVWLYVGSAAAGVMGLGLLLSPRIRHA
jgi:hypothetical protein